ncbi:MAG: hypothetical protein KBT30_01340, partial [Clostridiales bacterium]|nr:hypothetical protein [Candidatus Apopatousia equi]
DYGDVINDYSKEKYPLISEMTYTFEEDYYIDNQTQSTFLNKLMEKIGVEFSCDWEYDAAIENYLADIQHIVFTKNTSDIEGCELTNVNFGPTTYWDESTKTLTFYSDKKIFAQAYSNQLFANLENITDFDFSNFDTSFVQDARRMFQNCTSLKNLDISGFNFLNIIEQEEGKKPKIKIVSGCSSLVQGCDMLESITLPTLWNEDCEFSLPFEMYTPSGELVTSAKYSMAGMTLTKTLSPVEETGIDLYSGLAISGAMLILACCCAVVMSKMKRKQSM